MAANVCRNCGNFIGGDNNFCRFCGTRVDADAQGAGSAPSDSPPVPYAWRTDEHATSVEARAVNPAHETAFLDAQRRTSNFAPHGGPIAGYERGYVAPLYRCPLCDTTATPTLEKTTSTAGWITFAVLIFVFLPLCWVGFFIRDEFYVCPMCKGRIAKRT